MTKEIFGGIEDEPAKENSYNELLLMNVREWNR